MQRYAAVWSEWGAGAAVLAAAQRPSLVSGLVLTGPFVRNGKTSAMQRLLLRVAMAPLWAAISWKSYLPKLYAGRASRFRRIPRPGRGEPSPAGTREGVLGHHAHQPRPGRSAAC